MRDGENEGGVDAISAERERTKVNPRKKEMRNQKTVTVSSVDEIH